MKGCVAPRRRPAFSRNVQRYLPREGRATPTQGPTQGGRGVTLFARRGVALPSLLTFWVAPPFDACRQRQLRTSRDPSPYLAAISRGDSCWEPAPGPTCGPPDSI